MGECHFNHSLFSNMMCFTKLWLLGTFYSTALVFLSTHSADLDKSYKLMLSDCDPGFCLGRDTLSIRLEVQQCLVCWRDGEGVSDSAKSLTGVSAFRLREHAHTLWRRCPCHIWMTECLISMNSWWRIISGIYIMYKVILLGCEKDVFTWFNTCWNNTWFLHRVRRGSRSEYSTQPPAATLPDDVMWKPCESCSLLFTGKAELCESPPGNYIHGNWFKIRSVNFSSGGRIIIFQWVAHITLDLIPTENWRVLLMQ